MTDDCEAAVAGLVGLTLDELRVAWERWLNRDPPACRSKEVLRGLLAWEIQAMTYGGLSPETKSRLRELAKAINRTGTIPRKQGSQLMPGTTLSRDWHGATRRVTVTEQGFLYEGTTYSDLSSVARAITGTRWSGPRFFGLKASLNPSDHRKATRS